MLFKSSHKITRLNRDTFAKLGHDIPHPTASTQAELEENVEYFKNEIRRLGHSIAWINDKDTPTLIEVSSIAVL